MNETHRFIKIVEKTNLISKVKNNSFKVYYFNYCKMGNENNYGHFDTQNQFEAADQHTAQTDDSFNFQNLHQDELLSCKNRKISQFLDRSFKQKKIATKKIQFKVIQNSCHQKRENSKIGKKQSGFNLEEIDKLRNKDQNHLQEISQRAPILYQKSFFSIIQSNSQFQKTIEDKVYQKQSYMTRSTFSSYDSKYKSLNIRPEKFVKVRKHKFQDYYESLDKIGQGATGRVFTAKCKRTNQIRAVKIYKNEIMKKMSTKKTLHLQMDMLKSFDHSNIIKVFDVFHTQDLYYVVTQYCEGGSFQDYVTKNKPLDSKLIKIIFKQIFGALCYLHSLSIIHRDIKMDNIVFKKNPNECDNIDDVQIKIIDFGLAKKVQFKSLNKDQSCLGTPLYMAPQIIKGHYSQKCDIWACGVLLYYLLSDEFPFSSYKIQQIYKKIVSDKVDFTKSLWKRIDKDAKLLLQNMLQKNPSLRIGAKQALQSQWFQETNINHETKTQKDLLYKRLTSYKKQNNFVSVIEAYILFAKKNEKQGKIIRLFQKIDQNHNGCIEIHELQQIFNENILVNHKKIRNQMKIMISKIDKNNSGKIQISEFLSLFVDRNEVFTDECIENAFDFFDQDKDEMIIRQDMEKMLQGCDSEQFQSLWIDLDTDEDNKISKSEFMSYFKKINQHEQEKISFQNLSTMQN